MWPIGGQGEHMADQVMARNTSTFVLVPEGDYHAVCVDIVDLGMVENHQYGVLQHKVAIVFQLEDESGKRHEIAERFTLSMNEKARLRKFLEQWRGRPYKEHEVAEGVPLHKLEGQNGLVTVVHNQSGEKTYANVFSIRPLPKGHLSITASKYQRAQYWVDKVAKAQPPDREPTDGRAWDDQSDDDDLPF